MSNPGMVQVYLVGTKLFAAPLAGLGGVTREMAGAKTATAGDPATEEMIAELLDRSEPTHEAFARENVPGSKTAFGKAKAEAKKSKLPAAMVQLRREEGGRLFATPYRRDPNGPGFEGSGEEREIEKIADIWRLFLAEGASQH